MQNVIVRYKTKVATVNLCSDVVKLSSTWPSKKPNKAIKQFVAEKSGQSCCPTTVTPKKNHVYQCFHCNVHHQNIKEAKIMEQKK